MDKVKRLCCQLNPQLCRYGVTSCNKPIASGKCALHFRTTGTYSAYLCKEHADEYQKQMNADINYLGKYIGRKND